MDRCQSARVLQDGYQEDVVLSLHNLQQLDDTAMSQAAQNAYLPLDAPLIHCLLQDHPLTCLQMQANGCHHLAVQQHLQWKQQ